ncbi:hypothetical protein KC842_01140 [Candidatus Nomurabacteria bacterium]|nr:hypothetical protein [Candidatus Nomurabacteria bacterium]USN94680.1 MAG: hypothetical protein H6791_02900 [Candidatus Nomurabacteria bacterium]
MFKKIKQKIKSVAPYMPSKKLLIKVSIVCGCIVLFFVGKELLKKPTENDIKKKIAKRDLKQVLVSDLAYVDTDGDGVQDWEEYLWGTNPDSKDTDGDGQTDGVYIEQKRAELREKTGASADTADTQTEIFAREYFATLISLQEAGVLTSEAVNNLALTMSESFFETTYAATYSLDDINIVGSSEAEVLSYYNKLAAIYASDQALLLGDEVSYLGNFVGIDGGDKASLIGIQGAIESYTHVEEELKKINVPRTASEYHLAFLNAISGSKRGLIDLLNLWIDPVLGTRGLATYRASQESGESALDKITSYFSSYGII